MRPEIPSEKRVSDSVRRVLLKRPRIESLRELSALVIDDLRSESPDCRISCERIRRIAVSSGAAKVEIEYRGSPWKKLPDICPVCGNAMSRVMNNTLDGGLTEFKRTCTVCPYSIGQKAQSPGRYVFMKAPARETPERELRIRKLRKAASHLRAAKKLIADALEGTDFPERRMFSESAIDAVLSSKESSGSIPNLEADIRDIGHEDPLWTEALSSPKHPHRKDI